MPRIAGRALSAAMAAVVTSAVAAAQTITFENDTPGQPPKDFEFGLAGEGGPGVWQIVADKTAAGRQGTGAAFDQHGRQPVSGRDLQSDCLRKRRGHDSLQAGLRPGRPGLRADHPGRGRANYYIARSNALENNVRFYRSVTEKGSSLATAENVPTPRGQWHTLTLRAEGNRYTVSLNGKALHTTTDTTTAEPRPTEGRAGLWVKSDSVTHFERIEITKLP